MSTLISTRWRIAIVFVICAIALVNIRIAIAGIGAQAARGFCDLPSFEIGARMVAGGQRSQLYNLAAQARMYRQIFPERPPAKQLILPFNHLAYEALIFVPLKRFSFQTSYFVWMGFNLLLMMATAVIGTRLMDVRSRFAVLIFIAELAFLPVVYAVMQGQVSVVVLFLYALAAFCLKRKQDFGAGAILACGLFKFHLVIPFAFAFMLKRRWRVAGGFAAVAIPLLLLSIVITGLTGFHDYMRLITYFQGNPPELFANVPMMPNLRGLIMGSIGGIVPHVARALVVIASLVFVLLLLNLRVPQSKELANDLYIALAIVFTMLVSFHAQVYDLSPMFIALVLMAKRALAGDIRRAPVLAFAFLLACPLLYFVTIRMGMMNLITLTLIALSLFLAWFAVPERRSATTTAVAGQQ
jgi:hypothetical protein